MLKFLAAYLTITGIGAFIALAMPSLVTLGLFMLIVPGLVLGIMPTAFLWGLAYTAAYIATRSLFGDTLPAVIVAGVIAAAALIMVAQPSRIAAKAAHEKAQRPDVTPATRIAMTGDIRIDVPSPRWDNKNSRGKVGLRGFACDNLCIAALFTPGVTSVTINKSQLIGGEPTMALDVEARTFRLKPRGQCGAAAIVPDLDGRLGLFPNGKMHEGLENQEALNAEWKLKLSTDVCLTVEPAIASHDILIRQVSSNYGNNRKRWSLFSGPPRIESVEILDRQGKTLLLEHTAETKLLSAPLFVNFEGGIENANFDWGFSRLTDKRPRDVAGLLGNLDQHTNIVGRANDVKLFEKVRAALVAALENPSFPNDDPAFEIIGTYFNKVPIPLSQDDVGLIAALIAEPRVAKYNNIWKLKDLPADQMLTFRKSFAARAVSTDDTGALARSAVGVFLAKGPPGSFASLLQDEEQLLKDPARRWAYPGLLERLSDGGSARVPQIVELMQQHIAAIRANREEVAARRSNAYDKSTENEGHRNMIAAGRRALCVLGPDASSARSTVDAMSAAGESGSDWDLMRVRLGTPIESLRKPANMSGSDVSYQRNIGAKLKRFERTGEC